MDKSILKIHCIWFAGLEPNKSLVQFNIDYSDPYYIIGGVDFIRQQVFPISAPLVSLSSALVVVFEKLRKYEIESGQYPQLKNKKNLTPYQSKAEELSNIVKLYEGHFRYITIYGNKKKYPPSANTKFFEDKLKEIFEFLMIEPHLNGIDEILFDELLQKEISQS